MILQVRQSIEEDIQHLQSCLDCDEFHKGQKASDWAECLRLISFHSDIGPVYHVGIQQEGTERRISFQHDQTVGKKHLAVAMSKGIAWLKQECRKEGTTALVFNSTAPSLIAFFIKHHGFVAAGNDDFKAGL
jgi:hypothetical protein